jgi:hypothetical protein
MLWISAHGWEDAQHGIAGWCGQNAPAEITAGKLHGPYVLRDTDPTFVQMAPPATWDPSESATQAEDRIHPDAPDAAPPEPRLWRVDFFLQDNLALYPADQAAKMEADPAEMVLVASRVAEMAGTFGMGGFTDHIAPPTVEGPVVSWLASTEGVYNIAAGLTMRVYPGDRPAPILRICYLPTGVYTTNVQAADPLVLDSVLAILAHAPTDLPADAHEVIIPGPAEPEPAPEPVPALRLLPPREEPEA